MTKRVTGTYITEPCAICNCRVRYNVSSRCVKCVKDYRVKQSRQSREPSFRMDLEDVATAMFGAVYEDDPIAISADRVGRV